MTKLQKISFGRHGGAKFFVACFLALGLSQIANAADPLIPPNAYTLTGTGVNLSDGSFLYRETDLSAGALSFERVYMSGPPSSNSGGFTADPNVKPTQWHHNFVMSLTISGPSAKNESVNLGDHAYTFQGTGAYMAPVVSDVNGTSLIQTGSGYEFVDRAGVVYEFNQFITDGFYRVSSIKYTNGRTVSLIYNSSKVLTEVLDTSGYALVFDYNASGEMADACIFNTAQSIVTSSTTCASAGPGQKVSYGYTTSGSDNLLTSFTDRLGQTTTYQYTDRLPLATTFQYVMSLSCIIEPGQSACRISNIYTPIPNSTIPQVTQQVTGDGSVWNYQYSGSYIDNRRFSSDEYGLTSTRVFDPSCSDVTTCSYATYYFRDSSPLTQTDRNGNRTTYQFVGNEIKSQGTNSSGNFLNQVVLPEGVKIYNVPDGRENRLSSTWTEKPSLGSATITTSATFPPNGTTGPVYTCSSVTAVVCNQPISVTDGNGNETDYTYDSTHGGVLTDMGPAPVAGGARPLKIYTYAAQYAQYKNASGVLVNEPSPIWLRTSMTECQTTAGSSSTICDTGAPITVTNYEYGAGGTVQQLMLTATIVSSGGISRRACYGYDALGNRISTTAPRAGLTVCS